MLTFVINYNCQTLHIRRTRFVFISWVDKNVSSALNSFAKGRSRCHFLSPYWWYFLQQTKLSISSLTLPITDAAPSTVLYVFHFDVTSYGQLSKKNGDIRFKWEYNNQPKTSSFLSFSASSWVTLISCSVLILSVKQRINGYYQCKLKHVQWF